MRPAGIAAIVGSVAFQLGLYVGGGALDGDSTAQRLLEASNGDADGELLLGVIVSGLGFLLMGAALTHLFLAARARSPRVLRQLVALPLLGAVLVASGLVLNNFTYLDAADSFAASEAEREATPAEPETEQSSDGESSEDAEDEADDRAEDALSDASGASAAALLIRGGALAFAIGFLYTALWSMRTGLLSRFWGSLGMASAVVLALFFLYFFGLVWFLALGLLLLGAWVGGRPPAWEAGAAVPWPKPGEQPDARDALAGQDRDETVEGGGREIGRGEGDPGGGPDAPGPDAPGPDEPLAGEPPQKRKRRR